MDTRSHMVTVRRRNLRGVELPREPPFVDYPAAIRAARSTPWKEVCKRQPDLQYRIVRHLQTLPAAVVAALVYSWTRLSRTSDFEEDVLKAGWRRAWGAMRIPLHLLGVGGMVATINIAPTLAFFAFLRRLARAIEETSWDPRWAVMYGSLRLTPLNWPEALVTFCPLPRVRPLVDTYPIDVHSGDPTCDPTP